MNSNNDITQLDELKSALRSLSAAQRQSFEQYSKAIDCVGTLLVRANDALHTVLNRQPDPGSAIESMRLDDDDAPPIAEGFEPAILQAVEQLNTAYACLFIVAGDALSACMVAVSEERRLLDRQASLNEQ